MRLEELLDWLGRQLGLHWLTAAPASPAPAAGIDSQPPGRAQLQALRDVVNLGYPRGVHRLMDQIEAQSPGCAAWLAPLRSLAHRFEFDRMTPVIQDALDRSETA